MSEAFGLTELRHLAYLPQITLDTYLSLPEDVCRQIEVLDGWMVRCERLMPSHQTIARNLANHLWEAVKQADRRDGACHRVSNDMDVLFAEEPSFHIRCPDVLVYRCLTADRGQWAGRPRASDCVLVIEIVSTDSVTTDLRDKRAEYAAAGIPYYWIVRMEANNGQAVSVERLVLTANGDYVRDDLAVRRVDFHAVAMTQPFSLKLGWDQLDDGL